MSKVHVIAVTVDKNVNLDRKTIIVYNVSIWLQQQYTHICNFSHKGSTKKYHFFSAFLTWEHSFTLNCSIIQCSLLLQCLNAASILSYWKTMHFNEVWLALTQATVWRKWNWGKWHRSLFSVTPFELLSVWDRRGNRLESNIVVNSRQNYCCSFPQLSCSHSFFMVKYCSFSREHSPADYGSPDKGHVTLLGGKWGEKWCSSTTWYKVSSCQFTW